ncbi:MAG TPA: RHS repeat-associated core domain-containing protein, partial [Gemmatimonadaceae bacterium]|nr:RHS repeat-associated core domain-containing protein [Gemmatimonadaceae bacterium]
MPNPRRIVGAFARRAVVLSLSLAAVYLASVGRPAAAQGVSILGTNGQSNLWLADIDLLFGDLKLLIKNNTASSVTLSGGIIACSVFDYTVDHVADDGSDAGYWDEPCRIGAAGGVIAAGATGTVELLIPLYGPAAGDIKLHVGSGWTWTDSLIVHVTVTDWSGHWTATTSPFPAATYTPSLQRVAPHTVPARGFNVQQQIATNRGNVAGNFTFTLSCTGTLIGCSTYQPNVTTVPAGGSYIRSMTFNSGLPGTGGTIRLIMTAPPRANGLVEADTSDVVVTVVDVAPPTVYVSPPANYDYTTGQTLPYAIVGRTGTITVNSCDNDGTLAAPTFTFGGTLLTPTSIVAVSNGCLSASRATYDVTYPVGLTHAIATASDGVHQTNAYPAFLYDDSLDNGARLRAVHPAFEVAPSSFASDTFVVSNPGWKTSTYSLLGSCAGSTAPCDASPASVTLAPGDSARVAVSYGSYGIPSSLTRVTLTARYSSYSITDHSASFTATVRAAPPQITITPADGSTYSDVMPTVQIDWCDADDQIVQHSVTWQGATLADTYAPTTRAGCVAAGRSIYTGLVVSTMHPAVVAAARDAAGHSTTDTATYSPPAYKFAPAVYADGEGDVYPRAAVGYQAFAIYNVGSFSATYGIAASCGTMAVCAPTRTSVTLLPRDSLIDSVRFVLPASYGVSNTVTLTATYTPAAGPGVSSTAAVSAWTPPAGPLVRPTSSDARTVVVEPAVNNQLLFSLSTTPIATAIDFGVAASCLGATGWFCSDGSSGWVHLTSGSLSAPAYVRPPAILGGPTAPPVTVRYVASLWNYSTLLAADTGVVQAVLAYHTPSIVPKGTAITASSGSARTDTFVVTNRGNAPVLYAVTGTCGTFSAAGCVVAPTTLSVAAGASAKGTIRYTLPLAAARTDTIKLIVRYQPAGTPLVEVDTGRLVVTTQDQLAPTMAIIPTEGSVVTTRAVSLVISVCDADGAVSTPTANLNGVAAAGTYATLVQSGCASAGTLTVPALLQPGLNTVVAATTDGVHPVSLTRTIRYDETAEHTPIVAARLSSEQVGVSRAWADSFTVRNPGTLTAVYALTASCPAGVSGCIAPPTLAVAGGETASIGVSYTTGTASVRGSLRLTAAFTGANGTTVSSSDSTSLFVDALAPTVVLAPSAGASVGPDAVLTAQWCDADGSLAIHSATIDGVSLANTFTAASVPGCASAGASVWSTTILSLGAHTLAATVTDGAGHSTTATSAFTVTVPPIASFQPSVTPKSTAAVVTAPGDRRSQVFVIQNSGSLSAQYDLSAGCGTWSSVGACTVDRPSLLLAPGARDSARVTYAVGQPSTTAVISLAALHRDLVGQTAADTGSIVASTPNLQTLYSVGVTHGADFVLPPWTTIGFTWTIKNNSAQTNTYRLGYNMGATVLVQVLDSVAVLAPGQSRAVTVMARTPNVPNYVTMVTLNVWAVGSNGLEITGGNLLALSGINVMAPVPSYRVVASQLGQTNVIIPYTGGSTSSFEFTNTGASSASFAYQATCTGIVVNCRVTSGTLSGTVTLASGQSQSLPVVNDFLPVAQQQPNATGTAQLLVTGVGTASSATASAVAAFTFLSPPSPHDVIVAPTNGSISAPPNQSGTAAFTITNNGTQSDAFAYAIACSSALACSTPNGTTAPLSAGGATTVAVAYRTGSAPGTAAITLAATSVGDPTRSKSGSYAVASSAPVAVIAIRDSAVNPLDAISRGACLTIAAGEEAAYECGDLRLVHSFPATTTMNRLRAPSLVYTSAHAHPVTLVANDVTLDGTVCPQQVTLTVSFGAADTSQRSFDWTAPCGQPATRRLVVPIDAIARSHPTGIHRYTVEARITTAAGTFTATDTTASLVVVDRSSGSGNHFGPGWWLDGLEQLVAVPGHADQMLWIGGDGSTRLYRRSAVDSVFLVQPALDRPDTLLRVSATQYRRLLPNGAYVQFDGFLRHVATVNSLGHRTRFVWDGVVSTQLDSIVLPTPTASVRRAYAFLYSGGLLTGVVAPPSPIGARVTSLARSGADLAIADPGLPPVHYLADGLGRVIVRTNRLGDGTRFDYDAASGTLRGVALDMARTGGDSIRTTFCAAEAASVAACAAAPADPANVRTLVDGARTDVADTTAFYLTRFGAPARIVDALGHSRRLDREDSNWPMLVTRVTDARGHVVMATYDPARGLVRTTTDVDPNSLDASTHTGSATTTYEWDAHWDHATRIVSPANVTSRFTYDSSTGLRTSQSIGDNGARLVTFGYDAATRLVASITTRQSATPTRYDYDAAGNLLHTTTPRGLVSTDMRDAIGRDSIVKTPINDVPTTDWRYQALTYDLQDRVVSTADSARTSAGSSPWEVLRVSTQYDNEGHAVRTTRQVAPDPLQLGDIVIGADFDAAGRQVREFDPNRLGIQDTKRWTYDPAGNAISTTRGDAVVTAEYDALNRVLHRVVPGAANEFTPQAATDDQRFAYDAGGNLVVATNNNARVGRAYTLGGRLVLDTLRIATADLASADFGRHVYLTQLAYDLAGRRTQLTPPGGLGILTPVAYGYDAESGDLTTITAQNRGTFRFSYTPAGLLDSLVEADGAVERHFYDDDGRETRRSETSPVLGVIHDDALGLDGRGKRLQVVSTGIGRPEQSTFDYDGLGAATGTNGMTIESTPRDPLGNSTAHVKSTSLWQENYQYEPHSTRLHYVTQQLSDDFKFDSLSQSFDLSGDLVREIDDISGPKICTGGLGGCPPSERRQIADMQLANAYDGDGHLLLAIKETSNDQSAFWPRIGVRDANFTEVYPQFERGVLEEYRYDALGRRVWTRAHRNAYCPGPRERDSTSVCVSTIERTIYDGDQVLAEIRQPGDDSASAAVLESDVPVATAPLRMFGLAGYINGPTIDRPLAMDRNFDGNLETAVLHFQWQGSVDVATTYDGHPLQCGMGPGVPAPTVPCEDIAWPGATQTFGIVLNRPTRNAASWWGTMATLKQNATGKLDMRNRQYDSRTGRFTQEDPMGLAGGANLYGFGGGDAVNYSDPFGL